MSVARTGDNTVQTDVKSEKIRRGSRLPPQPLQPLPALERRSRFRDLRNAVLIERREVLVVQSAESFDILDLSTLV